MKIRYSLFSLLWAFAFVCTSVAWAGPQTFNYSGQLMDAAGNPIADNAAAFTIGIYSPGGCLLYEENHIADLSASNGHFSVSVGSGSPTGNDPGNSIQTVFNNNLSSIPGDGCSYNNPGASDHRNLRTTVSSIAGTETLPSLVIQSVPFATVAESVGGFTPSMLLKVNTAGPNLSQANLESLFMGSAWPNMQAVAAGNYMTKATGAGASLPSYSGNPGSPAAGSIWFDSGTNSVKFHDGATVKTLSTSGAGVTAVNVSSNLTVDGAAAGSITTTGTIDLANTGVTAGSYPKVTVDAKGRVTAGSATLLETDLPATISTPGRVSGDAITSGTIGGATNISTTGTVSAASSSFRQIDLYDSDNSNYVRFVTPATGVLTANYTLTWPADDGTAAGQVLTTDGNGNLTWAMPSAGTITAVTASPPLASSGGATPNITIPQAGAASDGYLSMGDWNTFNTKLSGVSNSATLADGKIWIGDGGNKAQERSISGAISITNTGAATIANDVVGFANLQNINTQRLLGRGTAAIGDVEEISLGAGLTLTGTTLDVTDGTDDDTLAALVCASNELPRWNGAAWVCQLAASANGTGTLVLRDATGNFAANAITANSLKVNNAGSTVNIASPIGANYNLTLPVDDGLANQVLQTDGAGVLTWVTAATGSVNDVTASPPLASSGGATPNITISQATAATDGYLSMGDWNTFNNKLGAVAGSALGSGQIWVGNGSSQAMAVTVGGDITIDNAGVANLASNAVTSVEILNGTITTADIGDGQVMTADLGDDQVTTLKILDSSVTSAKIQDGAVTTAKVSDQNITFNKIQNVADNRLLGRSAGSAGSMQEITVGAGLNLVSGVLSATASGTGDFKADGSVPMTGNLQLNGNYLSGDGGNEGLYVDNSGRIGIGTTNPMVLLDVSGQMRYADGNQAAGKVLTSDALGFATWQTPSGGLTGATTANYVTLGPGADGTANGHVAIGPDAAFGYTGVSSTFLGAQVASSGGTGGLNTILGYRGSYFTPINGSSNTAVGAMTDLGSFSNAIAIGKGASITGNGGVAIGTGAVAPAGSIVIGTNTGTFQERIRVDSAGNMGVGVATPVAPLHVQGNSSSTTAVYDVSTSTGSVGPGIFGRRSRGTAVAPTGVTTSDTLLTIGARGHDGTAYSTGFSSGIRFTSSELWSPSAQGSYASVYTTASGTITPVERLRISHDGKVGVGIPNPSVQLDVAGAIKIGNTVDTCAMVGAGAIRYNGTALEICDGAAWNPIGGGGSGITNLSGDVTATGPGAVTATINNDVVTFAKMQNVNGNVVLGRSGVPGDIQELGMGSGLEINGGALGLISTCGFNDVLIFDGSSWNCMESTPTNLSDSLVLRNASGDFQGNQITAANALSVGIIGTVKLRNPADANYTLNLPATPPAAGEVLYAVTGAGDMGWMTAGNFSADGSVAMTGPLRGYSGSSGSSPAFTFNGDTDTGIFSSAADTIGFATGGAERMRMTTTGIGIGGISPVEKLHLGSSANLRLDKNSSSTDPVIRFGSGTTGMFHQSGNVGFSANGVEAMRMASSGNIGISQTNPQALLDVGGAIKIAYNTEPCSVAAHAGLIRYNSGPQSIDFCNGISWQSLGVAGMGGDFRSDGSIPMAGQLQGSGGNPASPGYTFSGDMNTGMFSPAADQIGFTVGGNTKATLTPSGFVIGSTTTSSLFRINSTTQGTETMRVDMGGTGLFRILHQTSNHPRLSMLNGTGLDVVSINSSGDSYLNGGNVGIGTASPAAKLDVNGTLRVNDGTAQAGRVLASNDSAGNAQWKQPKTVHSLQWSLPSVTLNSWQPMRAMAPIGIPAGCNLVDSQIALGTAGASASYNIRKCADQTCSFGTNIYAANKSIGASQYFVVGSLPDNLATITAGDIFQVYFGGGGSPANVTINLSYECPVVLN